MIDISSEDALTQLMFTFREKCLEGATNLLPEAMYVLATLATIELAWVMLMSEEDRMMLLTKKAVKFSIWGWLVQNWVQGLNLTGMAFLTFQRFGVMAAGSSTAFADPASIGGHGIYIVTNLMNNIFSFSGQASAMGNIGLIILKIFMLFVILGCFFWMAIQLFLTTVEFYMTSTLTQVLVPFGTNKHTAFLAEKSIGSIFSFGVKIMVLEFILCISVPMMLTWQQINAEATDLSPVFRTLLGCLAIAFLTWKAPDVAQGMLSGSPSLSGGDAVGMARGAASVATGNVAGAVASGMRIAGFAKAASNQPGGRTANGNVSLSGTAKNAASLFGHTMNPYAQARTNARHAFGQMRGNQKEDKDATGPKQQSS
ncbi:type IV secretion system protein [Sporomusa aerivorans]|uniref:type IV secretion system protein n=1 Tax=Sporomusa aerivorans TaxID=204936 RepID=UPI00352AB4FC